MTLLGLSALLRDPDLKVHFIACDENTTLLKKLKGLQEVHPNLKIDPTEESVSRFEALRHFLFRGRIADLEAEFRRLKPDAVISVQGGLEPSSLGILAARKAGIKAISYLAMPHSYQTMGAKLGRLLDWGTPSLIERPDAFITISHEMANLLRERGAKVPVEVVFPGVDTDYYRPASQAACREKLELPADAPVFACVGRIDFAQKQQDRLLRAIARPALEECHLVFGGDGPDGPTLDALIKSRRVSHRVRRIPWADNSVLYPAANAVVIPSRYEGVPLVMLEALACGTAVLGSDCDGMRDFLPEDARFDAGSSASVADYLRGWIDSGMPKPPEELCERVRQSMSVESFQTSFRSTLLDLVSQG